ncbi:MAG TPA: hypothetical protein VN687_02990 [Blastocatellia bacterium]|nr:hypothetical protein [Blastocatellia bacterium]
MTQLLAEVIKKVSEMPASEQDEFASFMLAELESEERWDALFSSSQDLLSKMADEALAELRAGETEQLDLDRDFPTN